ncbi:hypothetical protein TYRP_015930 [Tyrophagus putrescentiae]|nr:hypothetical protein TYRP_015930 [Tyrophagus putrescentiae]
MNMCRHMTSLAEAFMRYARQGLAPTYYYNDLQPGDRFFIVDRAAVYQSTPGNNNQLMAPLTDFELHVYLDLAKECQLALDARFGDAAMELPEHWRRRDRGGRSGHRCSTDVAQTDSANRPAARSSQGLAKYRSRGRLSLKSRRSCLTDHPSVVVTRHGLTSWMG